MYNRYTKNMDRGDGATSMVMHVYRDKRINFKSNMFNRPIRIDNFNLFTGTAMKLRIIYRDY